MKVRSLTVKTYFLLRPKAITSSLKVLSVIMIICKLIHSHCSYSSFYSVYTNCKSNEI